MNRKKHTLFGSALLGGVLWIAASAAQAHSVWIEPTADGQLIVRFAEPDGKFEKSPGHLDSLSMPLAFALGTNGAPEDLEVQKKSDHFRLVGSSAARPTALETTFQVMGGGTDSEPGPRRKPIFHARWHPFGAPLPPIGLALDLIPTGKGGEVRVYYRGKPQGGVKATLRTPDEKEREIAADADGYLKVETTQRGRYLLTVARHREKLELPGYYLGRAFDLVSHNASLAWDQP